MKFPLNFRSTPRGKARTDEEIRARLAKLTYHQDTPETNAEVKQPFEQTGSPPPRRPSSLPLEHDDSVDSKFKEATETTSSSNQKTKPLKHEISWRNTMQYKSPKQADGDDTEAFLMSTTPKKSSPVFSLNRKSIREPFAYLKQQGKEIFRRGNIKDLFPITPEKSNAVIRHGDHNAQEGLEVAFEHDSLPDNMSTKDNNHRCYQYDGSQSQYHTSRAVEPVELQATGKTPGQTAKFSLMDTKPMDRDNQQSSPRQSHAFSLGNNLEDVNTNKKEVFVSGSLLPKTVVSERLSSIAIEKSNKEQEGEKNSALNAMQEVNGRKAFKSAHKNFFPLWASERKSDGRWYTQKEIIERISPEEL